MQQRPHRFTALLVSAALLGQTLVPPVVWGSLQDRAEAPPVLDLASLTIPSQLGYLAETWQPTHTRPKGLVIHLQDLHTHPTAQTHLSQLIGYLHEHFGIELIALEGAEGLCDTTIYSDFPDPPSTEKIARLFMQEGLFTGAEYYAITHPGTVSLWGVEDESLYLEHLKTYQQGATQRAELEAILTPLRNFLTPLKARLYPKPLQQLLKLREAYEQSEEADATFSAYVTELWRLAQQAKLDRARFPHVQAMARALELHKQLDMRQVETESQQLLDTLWPQLSSPERTQLNRLAKALDAKQIPALSYYETLDRAAKTHDVSRPRAFRRYLHYERLSQKTQSRAFAEEFGDLEQAVEQALLSTDQSRTLAKLLTLTDLIDGLIHVKLSPRQHRAYQQLRSTLTADGLRNDLTHLLATEAPMTYEQLQQLVAALPTHERFYDLAFQRDEALVRHTLKLLDSRSTTHEPRATILIAGGFHTPGLTEQFKQQHIAYAVITPKVDGEFDESRYQAYLGNTLPPLSDLLSKVDQAALQASLSSASHSPAHTGSLSMKTPEGRVDQQPHTFGTKRDGVVLYWFIAQIKALQQRFADWPERLRAWLSDWTAKHPGEATAFGVGLTIAARKVILTAMGLEVEFDELDRNLVIVAVAGGTLLEMAKRTGPPRAVFAEATASPTPAQQQAPISPPVLTSLPVALATADEAGTGAPEPPQEPPPAPVPALSQAPDEAQILKRDYVKHVIERVIETKGMPRYLIVAREGSGAHRAFLSIQFETLERFRKAMRAQGMAVHDEPTLDELNVFLTGQILLAHERRIYRKPIDLETPRGEPVLFKHASFLVQQSGDSWLLLDSESLVAGRFEPVVPFASFTEEKAFYRERNQQPSVYPWGVAHQAAEHGVQEVLAVLNQVPFLYSAGWSDSGLPSDRLWPDEEETGEEWRSRIDRETVRFNAGRGHAGYIVLRLDEANPAYATFLARLHVLGDVDIVEYPLIPEKRVLRVLVPEHIIQSDMATYQAWIEQEWQAVTRIAEDFILSSAPPAPVPPETPGPAAPGAKPTGGGEPASGGNAAQEIGRTEDRDPAKGVEDQQVQVSGDKTIGRSGESALQKPVVLGVATGRHGLPDLDEHPVTLDDRKQAVSFRSRGDQPDGRSSENRDKFEQGLPGEQQRDGTGEEGLIDSAGGRVGEQRGDEHVGVNDDAHEIPARTAPGAPLRTLDAAPAMRTAGGQSGGASLAPAAPSAPAASGDQAAQPSAASPEPLSEPQAVPPTPPLPSRITPPIPSASTPPIDEHIAESSARQAAAATPSPAPAPPKTGPAIAGGRDPKSGEELPEEPTVNVPPEPPKPPPAAGGVEGGTPGPGPNSLSLERIRLLREFVSGSPEENIVGVVIYGSTAKGTAAKESDLDYLLVKRTAMLVHLVDEADTEFHRRLQAHLGFWADHGTVPPLLLDSPLDERSYRSFDKVIARYFVSPHDEWQTVIVVEAKVRTPGASFITDWVVVAKTPELEQQLTRLIQERIAHIRSSGGTKENPAAPDAPDVTPPRVGAPLDEGPVDRAIRDAHAEWKARAITAREAAERILEAFRAMREPEQLSGSLPTAIDLLNRVPFASQAMRDLAVVLQQYVGATDYTTLPQEAQRALVPVASTPVPGGESTPAGPLGAQGLEALATKIRVSKQLWEAYGSGQIGEFWNTANALEASGFELNRPLKYDETLPRGSTPSDYTLAMLVLRFQHVAHPDKPPVMHHLAREVLKQTLDQWIGVFLPAVGTHFGEHTTFSIEGRARTLREILNEVGQAGGRGDPVTQLRLIEQLLVRTRERLVGHTPTLSPATLRAGDRLAAAEAFLARRQYEQALAAFKQVVMDYQDAVDHPDRYERTVVEAARQNLARAQAGMQDATEMVALATQIKVEPPAGPAAPAPPAEIVVDGRPLTPARFEELKAEGSLVEIDGTWHFAMPGGGAGPTRGDAEPSKESAAAGGVGSELFLDTKPADAPNGVVIVNRTDDHFELVDSVTGSRRATLTGRVERVNTNTFINDDGAWLMVIRTSDETQGEAGFETLLRIPSDHGKAIAHTDRLIVIEDPPARRQYVFDTVLERRYPDTADARSVELSASGRFSIHRPANGGLVYYDHHDTVPTPKPITQANIYSMEYRVDDRADIVILSPHRGAYGLYNLPRQQVDASELEHLEVDPSGILAILKREWLESLNLKTGERLHELRRLRVASDNEYVYCLASLPQPGGTAEYLTIYSRRDGTVKRRGPLHVVLRDLSLAGASLPRFWEEYDREGKRIWDRQTGAYVHTEDSEPEPVRWAYRSNPPTRTPDRLLLSGVRLVEIVESLPGVYLWDLPSDDYADVLLGTDEEGQPEHVPPLLRAVSALRGGKVWYGVGKKAVKFSTGKIGEEFLWFERDKTWLTQEKTWALGQRRTDQRMFVVTAEGKSYDVTGQIPLGFIPTDVSGEYFVFVNPETGTRKYLNPRRLEGPTAPVPAPEPVLLSPTIPSTTQGFPARLKPTSSYSGPLARLGNTTIEDIKADIAFRVYRDVYGARRLLQDNLTVYIDPDFGSLRDPDYRLVDRLGEALDRLSVEERLALRERIITVALLETSPHLFESDAAEGFIGVNRAVFGALSPGHWNVALAVGLVDALRHVALDAAARATAEEFFAQQGVILTHKLLTPNGVTEYLEALDPLVESEGYVEHVRTALLGLPPVGEPDFHVEPAEELNRLLEPFLQPTGFMSPGASEQPDTMRGNRMRLAEAEAQLKVLGDGVMPIIGPLVEIAVNDRSSGYVSNRDAARGLLFHLGPEAQRTAIELLEQRLRRNPYSPRAFALMKELGRQKPEAWAKVRVGIVRALQDKRLSVRQYALHAVPYLNDDEVDSTVLLSLFQLAGTYRDYDDKLRVAPSRARAALRRHQSLASDARRLLTELDQCGVVSNILERAYQHACLSADPHTIRQALDLDEEVHRSRILETVPIAVETQAALAALREDMQVLERADRLAQELGEAVLTGRVSARQVVLDVDRVLRVTHDLESSRTRSPNPWVLERTGVLMESLERVRQIAERRTNQAVQRLARRKRKNQELLMRIPEMVLRDELSRPTALRLVQRPGMPGLIDPDALNELAQAIQRAIPSSKASFVAPDDVPAWLQQVIAAGDLRRHVPPSLRDQEFGGGEEDGIIPTKWSLKAGETIDPDGRLGQWLALLHEPAEDVSPRQALHVLQEALEQRLLGGGQSTQLLDIIARLCAYAGHEARIREKASRIQLDQYAGLNLFEELFVDRANLWEVLHPLVDEILREAPESPATADVAPRPLTNPAALARSLEGLWQSSRLTPEAKASRLAEMLRGIAPEAIRDHLVPLLTSEELKGAVITLGSHPPAAVSIERRAMRMTDAILEEALKVIRQEKAKWVYEEQAELKRSLAFRVVKGIPYGLWGANAGVCIAKDLTLWKKPHFLLLAMIDRDRNEVVGFVHLYTKTINSKRLLLIPGIEPTVEFLVDVRARDLYPMIERTLIQIAETGGYDALLMPTDAGILSNRSDITTEVRRNHYQPRRLRRTVDWSTAPSYPFSKVYLVWSRSGVDYNAFSSELTEDIEEPEEIPVPIFLTTELRLEMRVGFELMALQDGRPFVRGALRAANLEEEAAVIRAAAEAVRQEAGQPVTIPAEVLTRTGLPADLAISAYVDPGFHEFRSDAALLALLAGALARERAANPQLNLAALTGKPLTFILADEYTHLAGNHVGDGIVIIHRRNFTDPKQAFPDDAATADAVTDALLSADFAHELGAHELPGRGHDADEDPTRQHHDLANLAAFADAHLEALATFLNQPGRFVQPLTRAQLDAALATYVETLRQLNPNVDQSLFTSRWWSFTNRLRFLELYRRLYALKRNYRQSQPVRVLLLGPGMLVEDPPNMQTAYSPQTIELAAILSDLRVDWTAVDQDAVTLQIASSFDWYRLPKDPTDITDSDFRDSDFRIFHRVKKSLASILPELREELSTLPKPLQSLPGRKRPKHDTRRERVYKVDRARLFRTMSFETFRGDLPTLQYGHDELDLIISTVTLYHAMRQLPEGSDRLDLLERLIKALKPGGTILLDESELSQIFSEDYGEKIDRIELRGEAFPERQKKRLIAIEVNTFIEEMRQRGIEIRVVFSGGELYRISRGDDQPLDVAGFYPVIFEIRKLQGSQEPGPAAPEAQHFEALKLSGSRQPMNVAEELRQREGQWVALPAASVARAPEVQMVPAERNALWEALGLSDGAFGALIAQAFATLQRWGISPSQLPAAPLHLALLDETSSEHLFEDHHQNGFIGINGTLLQIAHANPRLARLLLIVGLAHELRHEAGIEDEHLDWDAALLAQLLQEASLTSDTLTALLAPHLVSRDLLDAVQAALAVADGQKPEPAPSLLGQARIFTAQGAGVPIPVKVEMAEEAFAHGMTDATARRIVTVASRQDVSGAVESGRSLIVLLAPEEIFRVGGRTFRAIKLKLVTHRGQPPRMESYEVPEDEVVLQPSHRLMVDHAGRIHFEPAPAHPTGGGYLSEAINEYRTMHAAFERGVPTAFPLGVGEFTAMSFQGERVGFVIMALEGRQDERAGFTLRQQQEEASERPAAEQRPAFQKTFRELGTASHAAARTLRRVHEAGITHGHPHLGNFSVPRDGTVQVYDFTNATLVQDMSRAEFITRVWNDVRALSYNAYSFVTQHHLSGEQYRRILTALGVKPSPLEAVVEGYFTSADRQRIGQARLRAATREDNLVAVMEWSSRHFNELEGKSLAAWDNDLVRIVEELAGALYDRLTATQQAPPEAPAAPASGASPDAGGTPPGKDPEGPPPPGAPVLPPMPPPQPGGGGAPEPERRAGGTEVDRSTVGSADDAAARLNLIGRVVGDIDDARRAP